jgi:hypothetical protein
MCGIPDPRGGGIVRCLDIAAICDWQSSLLFSSERKWHYQSTNTYTVLQKVYDRALFCLVVCKGGHATSQGACHAGVE